MTNLFRWLVLPYALWAAFVTAGLSGALLAHGLHAWSEPTAGFLAAIAVVLTAYFMAPRHRLQIVLVVFVAGAFTAVSMLGNSTFPEGHSRAYEPTLWPLAITLFGGVLGLALGALHTLLRRQQRPATGVPSTALRGEVLHWLALPVVLWTALVSGFFTGTLFEAWAAAPTGTASAFLVFITAISAAYWIAPRWRFMVASAVSVLCTLGWALFGALAFIRSEVAHDTGHPAPFLTGLICAVIAMTGISYCEIRRVRSQVNSPAAVH